MAVTKGFSADFSDIVTIGQPFTIDNFTLTSTYIYVPSGSEGDIVWLNLNGQANYLKNAQAGYHLIHATQIVSSATVNGVTRTTGASNMTWIASLYP